MEKKEQQFLLRLAREVIRAKLENENLKINGAEISDALKQKSGTFVTLKIGEQLRGCIGHIEPIQEICKDVAENACSAAFEDPRFSPLTKSEFEKAAIEISVLSPNKKLKYKSAEELAEYLRKNKPGVVLKKNGRGATFLPQVWEELPEVEKFLAHLCLKAGLSYDEWKRGVEIETYTVEKITEE